MRALLLIFIFLSLNGKCQQSICVDFRPLVSFSVNDTIRVSKGDYKELHAIQDDYYYKFIHDNGEMSQRILDETYVQVNHFIWGSVHDPNYCINLIEQLTIIDNVGQELYLQILDTNGVLLTTLKISERNPMSGGNLDSFAIISNGKLIVNSTESSVIASDGTNHKIAIRNFINQYNVANWGQIELIKTDTLTTIK